MATPRVGGLLPLLAAVLALGAVAARKRADGTHLELRPTLIAPCVGDYDNALEAMGATFEMRGRTTIVYNLNISVSRSVDTWAKGFSIIEKCDQTVSAATCRVFRMTETNDICGSMMSPLMPWAPSVQSVQPKLSCPVPKGHYRLTNGTLSMDLLSAVSGTLRLEGVLWRVRSHGVDPQGVIQFCVDTAGELFRVRNRPKKTSSTSDTDNAPTRR